MHIFHKWGKWSKQKMGVFGYSYYGMHDIGFSEKRPYQDRECETCGKYQWRLL